MFQHGLLDADKGSQSREGMRHLGVVTVLAPDNPIAQLHTAAFIEALAAFDWHEAAIFTSTGAKVRRSRGVSTKLGLVC